MQYRLHSGLRRNGLFPGPKYSVLFSPFHPACRVPIFSLLSFLCLGMLLHTTRAWSQEWKFVKGIAVGKYAERSATVPGRNEIYVANRGSCNLSVISTIGRESIQTIELGKTPKALVAGHDGRVYVLAQDIVRPPCELPQNEDGNYRVGIVNAESNAVESWVSLPGLRWDDMALTVDGRLFLTRVIESPGVYLLDTLKREFHEKPVIPGEEGCPVDLALAEQQNELFVSYQCGGWPGHDPIGIYCLAARDTCHAAYEEIASVSGFPNVGGVMSVSPDESFLSAYGDDACSSASYDHKGCPGNDPVQGTDQPTRILNLIDTDSLVVRTYAFPMGDDGKFVSFSPELEAYIGGQSGIKVMKKPGVDRPEKLDPDQLQPPIPKDDICHDLNDAGQIQFSRTGSVESMYAIAADASAVCIFERPAAAASAPSESPSQPSDRRIKAGKTYAIVMGINSYKWPTDPLIHAVDDAASVAVELEEQFGFDVTTLPGNLKCEGAACSVTKKQVMDAFQNLLYDHGEKRAFDPGDQLLVYVASHGDRWPDADGSSHPYLVTSDSIPNFSDPPNPGIAATEVDYRDIWSLLEHSNIRHVLFVVDSCFAGFYGKEDFGGPTFQIPLQNGKPFFRSRSLPQALDRDTGTTRKYLSASPFATQQVLDQSPFTETFVQALHTLQSSTAGYFTFESVLTQMVNLDPQPRPTSYGPSDTAHGDFLFVPHTLDTARQQLKSSLAVPLTH